MRENCLEQFEAHWNCLEMNNQEYYACRKPERSLNKCMFEKLVRPFPSYPPLNSLVDERLMLWTRVL